jgi:hypothetical protein
MFQIERIRLHLPAGFEHRATSIARLVGEGLAKQQITQDAALESVSIPRQRIMARTPDVEIANLIVGQIIAGYGGRQQ